MELKQSIGDRLEEIEEADVVVGILTKNVEPTILHVMNVVREGVLQYLSPYNTLIVVSDGFSTDRTAEIAGMFDISPVKKIVVEQMGVPGKGDGIRTVMEIAHQLNSKAIAFVDGDLLSIKGEWIQEMVRPVLYGRTDLVVPFYVRDKFDGVITNNLAYPFTRAYYGSDIRQPIGGEFCISCKLMEILRNHPLFPSDFGIDIFITTVASAERRRIREAMLGLKLHESTTKYADPESSLIPMFRQVVKTMFDLAVYYEEKNKKPIITDIVEVSEYYGPIPLPVNVNKEKMLETVSKRYSEYSDIYNTLLPSDVLRHLKSFLEGDEQLGADHWARIVWYIYKEYSKTYDINLIDALRVMWLARFAAFYNECKDMDFTEAEARIRENAIIFEELQQDILMEA
ncbi:glycosyltransferase [Methanolobus halotolerans]|uniref:Glycosyl transferase family 2 n=1 Tax=Methanolobus halotolerans TaxID=2052935 RepID=A0A4E0QB69_9EURY|nr:glycosyltransferase [Methanolobus halotolerans]TGC09784.1 glycosyl transferase family 2 [Methanolobus halotolerans]